MQTIKANIFWVGLMKWKKKSISICTMSDQLIKRVGSTGHLFQYKFHFFANLYRDIPVACLNPSKYLWRSFCVKTAENLYYICLTGFCIHLPASNYMLKVTIEALSQGVKYFKINHKNTWTTPLVSLLSTFNIFDTLF